jgi:hypothetical protein
MASCIAGFRQSAQAGRPLKADFIRVAIARAQLRDVLMHRRAAGAGCGSAVFRSRSLRSASENNAGRSAGMGRWNSAPGTIAIPRFWMVVYTWNY